MGNSYKSLTTLRMALAVSGVLLSLFTVLVAGVRALATLRPSTQVAYEYFTSTRRDVYVSDVEAGLHVNLTNSTLDDYGPQWSASGDWLLYRTFVRQGRESLTSLNMDTLKGSLLNTGSDLEYEPASVTRANQGTAYVFNIGYGQMWLGGVETVPKPIGYGFNPRLSPDEQWVLYYADTPDDLNAEAYAYNVYTHQRLNLTQHPSHDWSPAWSPNGSQIAFASARDGNAEIYLVDVACAQRNSCASEARRLTFTPESELGPAWSPDGNDLIYARDQGAAYQLFILSLADGTVRQITSGTANHRAPAWRP